MQKLSMVSYPMFGCMLSGILLSYLANNVHYWEYMHEYGLSFSDRRHFVYDNLRSKQHKQLTLARLAYFLFSIKVHKEASLMVDDYRIMLHFYRCYLISELSRFAKDSDQYKHQRKVSITIMEEADAAIDRLEMLPEVKTELLQSSEYLDLLEAFNILKNESENGLIEPHNMIHSI